MGFKKNSGKIFCFFYNIVYTFQKKNQITRNSLSFFINGYLYFSLLGDTWLIFLYILFLLLQSYKEKIKLPNYLLTFFGCHATFSISPSLR